MITFIGCNLLDHLVKAGVALQRCGVQLQTGLDALKTAHPVFRVLQGDAAHHTVHLVVHGKEEFRKIGAILAGDTRN